MALIICTLTICSVMPIQAYAGVSPFDDIKPDDYFYESVIEMHDLGIVAGYGGGKFGPYDNVSHAQVLTMLCRMARINTTMYDDGTSWYSGVKGWSQANIYANPSDWNAPASREDVARYIVDIYQLDLPKDTDEDDSDASIDGVAGQVYISPFTDTDSKNAAILYSLGVTVGVSNGDGTFSFQGNNNVTRGQTCVFLDRLRDNNLKAPTDYYNVKNAKSQVSNTTNTDQVLEVNKLNEIIDYSYFNDISAPEQIYSVWDMVDVWEYMMYNGIFEYEIISDTSVLDYDDCEELSDASLETYKMASQNLSEYAAFYGKLGFSCWPCDSRGNYAPDESKGYVKYIFKLGNRNGYSSTEVRNKIADMRSYQVSTIESLVNNGKLSADMSWKDKAEAIYKYIDYTFQYDLTYTQRTTDQCYIDRTAVCSGYVAVYNGLLHTIGIPAKGIQGDTSEGFHAWTKVTENGVDYFIDVTWGDPIPNRPNYSNLEWFWKTKDNFPNHIPDKFIYLK